MARGEGLGPLRSPPPTGNIPEAFLKLGGPPPHTPAPTPPPAGRTLGPGSPSTARAPPEERADRGGRGAEL